MNRRRLSRILLSENRGSRTQQLDFFAIVNLGIVQSLASGALTGRAHGDSHVARGHPPVCGVSPLGHPLRILLVDTHHLAVHVEGAM